LKKGSKVKGKKYSPRRPKYMKPGGHRKKKKRKRKSQDEG
jgi:hypothetical protein